MAEAHEMPQGFLRAERLVVADVRDVGDVVIRVDEDERRAAHELCVKAFLDVRRVRADDDDARDVARDKRRDAAHLLLRVVLRAVQQQRILVLADVVLDAVDDLCEEHVIEARHDNADRRGALRVEFARLDVRYIVEFFDGLLDFLTGFFFDGIVGVDDAGDRRDGHPRELRHVHDGCLAFLFQMYPLSLYFVTTCMKRSKAAMPSGVRL